MEPKVFTESFSVYLPAGTNGRHRAIARERGVTAASLIRLGTLDKIREFEQGLREETRGRPAR